jgi:tetratricopeptide (TPR) repeat protein
MTESVYTLYSRGREFLAAGHPHQAVVVLERAAAAEPEKGSIREALARALFMTGRFRRARREFAKAVDIGCELARQAAKIEAALADGAPEAFLYGESVYVKPTVGNVTSLFGSRWGRAHQGIDIAGPIDEIYVGLGDVVSPGTVIATIGHLSPETFEVIALARAAGYRPVISARSG